MEHFEPHYCPDCGLCWCGCRECKTSLTQGCICDGCDCEDVEHYHDECPAWQEIVSEEE